MATVNPELSPTPQSSDATRQPSPVPPTPTASTTSQLPTPTTDSFAHYASGEPALVWSFSLHMLSPTTGWAILKDTVDSPTNRILRTTDAGQTWYDVTPLEPPDGISRAFFLDGDRAWAVQPREQQAVVWQTKDGGQTWNSSEPLDLFNPRGITLTFSANSLGQVVGFGCFRDIHWQSLHLMERERKTIPNPPT